MRYLLLIVSSFVMFTSCKQKGDNAAKETSYTINGHVKGLQPADIVVLAFEGVENKLDTATIKGEVFEFKGQAAEPMLGYVSITDGSNKDHGAIELVVENAIISIEASKDSLNSAMVQGGQGNADLKTLNNSLRVYNDQLKAISDKIDALPEADTESFKKMEQEYYDMLAQRRGAIQQFATTHPASILSAFYTYQDLAGNIEDKVLASLYSHFNDPVKGSMFGKKINELLMAAKRLEIGNAAPELNLSDANGKPVLISSYKGKVLLIDFWASWCGPCRAENPNIVNAYNQFKQKGFDILGVSLDMDKDAWLKAISTDNLTWQHVSDLKQWDSKVVPLYGLTSIPANVLVDKEGKVIARDLRGEKLQAKLQELLP